MGNSRNKKVPKKRKESNKSKCQNTSDQKENVPKPEKKKVVKPKPNESIAMSKQLLLKKSEKRQSSRIIEKFPPVGKPIPSLAELERMYADTDEDDETPKTPSQTPSTPKKQEVNLLSPTTISKISERVMGLIENISDPKELLEEVAPLLDEPPPPVIPPKKKKKSGIPYIVGCKDRPQVIRKPVVKFCKGDDEYGVNPAESDEPDEPPRKRAKPSRIPNYSKSIFNAQSDEIAERLLKEDAEHLSDASADSSKTIEYDATPYQHSRPHSFSPLPSTSKDNQTFIKNDELFNESLKEINETKEAIESKIKPENSNDEVENEVKVIDMSYETIVIDDLDDKPTETVQNSICTIDDSVIEVEPKDQEYSKVKDNIQFQSIPNENDEECMIVSSSKKCNDQKLPNEPIVIEDEYSTIVNMDLDAYNNEPIEIIDVDDIIAENKSVLEKFKNNAAKELNKIITIVDVPTTESNSNTQQTNVTQTASDTAIRSNKNNTTSTQINQSNIRPQSPPREQSERRELPPDIENSSPGPLLHRSREFRKILTDFFNLNPTTKRIFDPVSNERMSTNNIGDLFARVARTFQTNSSNRMPMPSLPVTPTYTSQTVDNRRKETISVSPASNTTPTVTQQTSNSLQQNSPTPSRNLGDCPICLDALTSKGIASTICGHVFCLKCIQAAIRTNGKKCPTCRKALKGAGGGYHQLYL